MEEQTDPFNVWVNLAVRKADLSFREGRSADDERLKALGHERGGARVKFAIRQIERVALPLVDQAVERAAKFAPTHEQAELAVRSLCGLFEQMGHNVRQVAAYVAGSSGAVMDETNLLLERLENDLANGLRLAIPETPDAPERISRKRGRKLDPVWAKAFAQAYQRNRAMAVQLSDEDFRDWVRRMSPLGKAASPNHRNSVRAYRDRAERGDFDDLLNR